VAAKAASETPVEVVKLEPHLTTILASPILYLMILPLLLLDLSLEIYHRLAFPILGIPAVRRDRYIKLDRHRLPYLPVLLKVACAYCGYANGLLQYAARIAGETESYFCPIKHQAAAGFQPPPHHQAFADYGDAEGFHRLWTFQGTRKDDRKRHPINRETLR
jgi:hypothetical protein